jgi:hypothetical protein
MSFDTSRIAGLEGDRYSPNLRQWMRSRSQRAYRIAVYRNSDGQLYIGQLFEDDHGWFHGSRLNEVLCNGAKANSWAFSPSQLSLTIIPDFWARYERIGRCAIDVAHDRYFVGESTRWLTDGDTRSCLWCGEHTQRLHRWTEMVERERWTTCDSDGSPEGRDREAGLDGEAATARAEGIAQVPSEDHPNEQ